MGHRRFFVLHRGGKATESGTGPGSSSVGAGEVGRTPMADNSGDSYALLNRLLMAGLPS